MIDIDKFIVDFLNIELVRATDYDAPLNFSKRIIMKILKNQGIIYKDGQLQRIEDVTPKPFEIRKGKYYMCIKDYWSITYETTIFTKGKVYFSDVRNHLVADNGVSFVWSTNFDDYKDIIRPATEEEISQRMESAKAKEEGYSKSEEYDEIAMRDDDDNGITIQVMADGRNVSDFRISKEQAHILKAELEAYICKF